MIFKIRYLFSMVLLCGFCVVFPAEKLVLKTGIELGNSSITDFIVGGFVVPEWNVADNVKLSGGLMITNEEKTTVFLSNTVKFPLKSCELRLTDKFLHNNYNAWNIRDFLFFSGLGITVRRFDGMLGVSFRVITRKASFKESILEPFNFQYDFGVSLFPQPQIKKWNLRLGISNYDLFLIERLEKIIFSLKGNYRFSERLGVWGTVNLRPAGNFSLSAHYYSFYSQIGIRWAIF